MSLCSPSPGSASGEKTTRSCCHRGSLATRCCSPASTAPHSHCMSSVPGVSSFESNGCGAAGSSAAACASTVVEAALIDEARRGVAHAAHCSEPAALSSVHSPQDHASSGRALPHASHDRAPPPLSSVHVAHVHACGACHAGVLASGSAGAMSSRPSEVRACSCMRARSPDSMAARKRRLRCWLILARGGGPSTATKHSSVG
eukprot:scaffold22691_cov62-Phaeocystis_antarctica.AAC.2